MIKKKRSKKDLMEKLVFSVSYHFFEVLKFLYMKKRDLKITKMNVFIADNTIGLSFND